MSAMEKLPFPLDSQRPLVVGSVSDLDTWQQVTEPGAEPPCDVIEVRVDMLPEGVSVMEKLLTRPCPRPLIVTYRHESEGGARSVDEEERIATVRALLPIASAVDWEILVMALDEDFMEELRGAGVPLIASAHFFETTPEAEQMLALEECARESGAAITKFAFKLNCGGDVQAGVRVLSECEAPLAVMGMGELGSVSRLLYAQLGSRLVYGYLGSTPTAPGQWSAAEYREELARFASKH